MKRVICGVLVVCMLFSYAFADTWTCENCTFENVEANRFCGICGAERSSSWESGWECGICNVLNDEDATYCKGCGSPRNNETMWTCGACGAQNDRLFCAECGRGKDYVPEEARQMPTGSEAAGDIVKFGAYGGEAIEWRVLENDGKALYLLAERGLEMMPYNEQGGETTWVESSLRAWLNGSFYYEAFSDAERSCLTEFTRIKDKVSLLSRDDIAWYYNVDAYEGHSEALICLATQKAVDNGAWKLSEEQAAQWQESYDYPLQAGACWWWLRTTGETPDRAASVGGCGDVSKAGGIVSDQGGCVRPLIKVSY